MPARRPPKQRKNQSPRFAVIEILKSLVSDQPSGWRIIIRNGKPRLVWSLQEK